MDDWRCGQPAGDSMLMSLCLSAHPSPVHVEDSKSPWQAGSIAEGEAMPAWGIGCFFGESWQGITECDVLFPGGLGVGNEEPLVGSCFVPIQQDGPKDL